VSILFVSCNDGCKKDKKKHAHPKDKARNNKKIFFINFYRQNNLISRQKRPQIIKFISYLTYY